MRSGFGKPTRNGRREAAVGKALASQMLLIEYTAHALARMAERAVSRDQDESVLCSPQRSFSAASGCEKLPGMVERGS